VTHFFNKISVAVIELSKELSVGEQVHFLGAHTDFQQEITSMQIEHEAVEMGEPGAEIAVKVKDRVRAGDEVFRVTEES
jgi:putative protease